MFFFSDMKLKQPQASKNDLLIHWEFLKRGEIGTYYFHNNVNRLCNINISRELLREFAKGTFNEFYEFLITYCKKEKRK